MSKRSKLLGEAQEAAAQAACTAVTKIMKKVTADKGLPIDGLEWTIRHLDDWSPCLSGHIEAGTPDFEVRAIVETYAFVCGGPDVKVGEHPHGSDPAYRMYLATGLVIDDTPVGVWGVLGYSVGESGE